MRVAALRKAGTQISSALSSRSSPWEGANAKPVPAMVSGPFSAAHTAKSYTGRPWSLRSIPKTSQKIPNSKGATSSRRATATLFSMTPVWQ